MFRVFEIRGAPAAAWEKCEAVGAILEQGFSTWVWAGCNSRDVISSQFQSNRMLFTDRGVIPSLWPVEFCDYCLLFFYANLGNPVLTAV